MRLTKLRVAAAATAASAALVTGGLLAIPADAASSCYAKSGHLYCGNLYNAPIKQIPANSTNGGQDPVRTVDYLRTTFSYFQCYVTGQQHSGGNNIWYHTYGDVTHKWGYVAAVNVWTSKDPFPGVSHC